MCVLRMRMTWTTGLCPVVPSPPPFAVHTHSTALVSPKQAPENRLVTPIAGTFAFVDMVADNNEQILHSSTNVVRMDILPKSILTCTATTNDCSFLTEDIMSSDILIRLSTLETQLVHTNEKVKMREHVIEQLEEEIQAKERLIYEQGHLIHILESENKFDEQAIMQRDYGGGGQRQRVPSDKDSVNSDSEITIIDRFASSSSPCHSNSNYSDQCDRLRERLEQALIEREKLELQNEQLLKQWEEALEYVTTVQKQLQEEIRRNTELKNAQMEVEKSRHDSITISRTTLNFIMFIALFIAFYLYRI
ncbi:hypothetical protein RB195_009619 [Necator americanus]|uniref:Uncharacterized protein n=2 Tax=Necator americanus TaxID=51031 RepID=A0ABR1CVD9_NECAM